MLVSLSNLNRQSQLKLSQLQVLIAVVDSGSLVGSPTTTDVGQQSL